MRELYTATRSVARHAALDALAIGRRFSGRTTRDLSRPRVHFLYLHAVPAHEVPTFRRFVAEVAEHHDLVSYSRAVELAKSDGPSRPNVCFSFDDAFASNFAASRVLEEFGTTACFFVPTRFVGCDSVTEARRFYGVSDGVNEIAMTWSELEDMVSRGHEVGNHTMSHRVISELSESEVYDEISGARETLRERLDQGMHFAWPRGRFVHFTPYATRTVFETGHLSCASAVRGSHESAVGQDQLRMCIRRDHIKTSWPVRHSRYFVGTSSARAGAGAWPADWEVA